MDQVLNRIFGGTMPLGFVEPDDLRFNVFKKRAFDLAEIPRSRQNDTELKYVFNLIDIHWNKGNRFVIELESVLYTCESCQGYLLYLKELAKTNGKTLEIKMIANRKAVDGKSLRELFN